MKFLIVVLSLTAISASAECFKTPGSKSLYKPFRNYPNVLEKYEPKADGRFLASFEPARTEEGDVIYEAQGLEKVSPSSQKEDYFQVECPIGMR